MHHSVSLSHLPKPEAYAQLSKNLTSLLDDERDVIANCANAAALLFHSLPDLNWAGFYFIRNGDLVLGPFQGRPACVRIAVGKGVCGTAVQTRECQIVPDVHAFPGHIACDAESRSEIVIPLLDGERLIGVLDLDSPIPGRFDVDDRNGLQRFAAELISRTDFTD